MLRLLSLVGLLGFVAICWLASTRRKNVNWRTVFVGLGLQFVLGLVFLRWESGKNFLYGVGEGVKEFLNKSIEGATFMFGPLGDIEQASKIVIVGDRPAGGILIEGIPQAVHKFGFLFAFQVLPTIIFFSAFMGVLYHLGVMTRIVRGIAWLMVRTMRTSGSESLSVASNIFVGQTEAPLLIRPFLPGMTNSELMAVMTGGFATIAGGVFALYVGFGVPAGHLIVASVMSAPAALVIAKLLVPETEESETMGAIRMPPAKTTANSVEAAANGATDGLKLALNVGAMLIAFLGLIAVANWILMGISSLWIDAALVEAGKAEYWTLQKILGYVFAPLAFMLGVDWGEILHVGELLGYKVAVNELLAYERLTSEVVREQLSERSFTIATYALCGFANLSSIAIQIGGIAALAPDRRSDLARLGVRAMLGGAVASWTTACVVGILL